MYLKNINVKEKLSISIFKISNIRYDIIHQVILWQQLSKRKIIAKTKRVSEIFHSTRKIYKQKGTGRARHGSIKSSCFIGGGITFGPVLKRNYSIKVNKKIKRIAIIHSLALKYLKKNILLFKTLHTNNLMIKNIFIKSGIIDSTKILFVDFNHSILFLKTVSNLNRLNFLDLKSINTLDILRNEKIFFSQKAFKNLLFNLQ